MYLFGSTFDFGINKLFCLFFGSFEMFVLTLICFELHLPALHGSYFVYFFVIFVLMNSKMLL